MLTSTLLRERISWFTCEILIKQDQVQGKDSRQIDAGQGSEHA